MGITYEEKSDMIQVMAEGLNHFIGKPKEIYVENNGVELLSVEVIDSDEVRQIIKLRDPLPLPTRSAYS